jgi:hypothetical protein
MSDRPVLLAMVRGEEGNRRDLLLCGAVPSADATTPVVLRCDGVPFGVTAADASVEMPVPEGTMPFTYPLPIDLLDGARHQYTAEILDGAVSAPLAARLPAAAQPTKKPITAAIGAIVKNEAPYLVEWYAYHRMLGFEHFTIYDNGSTDDTAAILAILAETGTVTTKSWTQPEAPQFSAYADILAAMRGRAEWLLFADLDEFLILPRHKGVQDFLGWHRGASAIALNWAMFGSGGQSRYDPRPVTARFTQRAERDFVTNRHAKTMVRPERALRMSIHHAQLAGGRYTGAGGERLCVTTPFTGHTGRVDWSLGQLNHYFCKSREEWQAKRQRGRADMKNADPRKIRREADFDELDRNEVSDTAALGMQAALGAAIAELRDRFPALAPYCPEI